MTGSEDRARVTTWIPDNHGRLVAVPDAAGDPVALVREAAHEVWIDVEGTPEQAADELTRFHGLPQLGGLEVGRAVEGGEYPPHRPPKAKAFENWVFVRTYWLGPDASPHKVRTQEVHVLAGQSFAITLRYPAKTWDMMDVPAPASGGAPTTGTGFDPDTVTRDVSEIQRRWSRPDSTDLTSRPGFGLQITVAILDQIADSVFDCLNAVRTHADDLEARVVTEATSGSRSRSGGDPDEVPHETLRIRRLLRQIRWAFLPDDEIEELRWGPFLGIEEGSGMDLQLTDLRRESVRALETVHDLIHQVQQIVELSNSLKTDRLDRTIHTLTLVATALLVPTLLAGIWGMNFLDVPMAGWRGGFWIAVIALLGIAFAVFWVIQRRLNDRGRRRP